MAYRSHGARVRDADAFHSFASIIHFPSLLMPENECLPVFFHSIAKPTHRRNETCCWIAGIRESRKRTAGCGAWRPNAKGTLPGMPRRAVLVTFAAARLGSFLGSFGLVGFGRPRKNAVTALSPSWVSLVKVMVASWLVRPNRRVDPSRNDFSEIFGFVSTEAPRRTCLAGRSSTNDQFRCIEIEQVYDFATAQENGRSRVGCSPDRPNP